MSVKCATCGSPLEWTVWGTRPATVRLDADKLAVILSDAFPALVRSRWPFTVGELASSIAAAYGPAPDTHQHEYDYADSRCVKTGLYPVHCEECGACEVVDTCKCGFQRRLPAPAPDTLRAAAHPHDGRDHPECLCPCCINARTLAAIVANAAPYIAALGDTHD